MTENVDLQHNKEIIQIGYAPLYRSRNSEGKFKGYKETKQNNKRAEKEQINIKIIDHRCLNNLIKGNNKNSIDNDHA